MSVFEKADDSVLVDYLLQIVQALRYEKDMRTCKLADFLIKRAIHSFDVAHYLHWYLTIESEDREYGDMYRSLHTRFWNDLKKVSRTRFVILMYIE